MSYRILLIEDNAVIRKALASRLSKKGFYVKEAQNGEHALGLARRDLFELVITDLRMPGIDGLSVLKRIKEFSDDIGVLIYTGHANLKSAIEALRNGADEFLIKGSDLDDVVLQVQKILEKVELKRAYKQLQEKYRNLIENLNEAIGATDRDGVITYMSPSITGILGYTPEEMVGRSYKEFVYPEDLRTVEDAAYSGLEGNSFINTNRLIKKDGDVVWVRFSGYPRRGERGVEAVHMVLTDITETQRLTEELVRKERLAAIGELAAFVAHDINTPLQGIYSILDYLKKRGDRDPDLMDKLNLTYDAIRKINSTVDILIGMENTHHAETTTLNTSITRVFRLAECYLKAHGVSFRMDLDDNIPALEFQEKDFEYFLISLIRWMVTNGCKGTKLSPSDDILAFNMPGISIYCGDVASVEGGRDIPGGFLTSPPEEWHIRTFFQNGKAGIGVSFGNTAWTSVEGKAMFGMSDLPGFSEVEIVQKAGTGDENVIEITFPVKEAASIDKVNR